jgi:hypothetical protein
MPDERATVTRERYRNANVTAGCIRPCVMYFTHGWPRVGVRQLLTGNRSNKGVSMNSNSEENKDHVELTEKSAQQWLKIRRYPVRDHCFVGLELIATQAQTGMHERVPESLPA